MELKCVLTGAAASGLGINISGTDTEIWMNQPPCPNIISSRAARLNPMAVPAEVRRRRADDEFWFKVMLPTLCLRDLGKTKTLNLPGKH